VTPEPPRPLIRANHVTVARLLPLPLCAWLLYQGTRGIWAAFIIGMLVASTDFIDGYLARKHGPTVLGGLLDPIADKVFISVFFLVLADVGVFPAWAVALLFVREFVVTGIRSAFEQRGMSMRTSYLAKVKTWVQMQTIGFVLLVQLLPEREIMLGIIGAVVAGSLITTAIVSKIRGRLFVSGVIMAGACAAGGVAYWALSTRVLIDVTLYLTVALTWWSGADYLVGGIPRLRRAGDFNRADAVRLIAAVLLPVLAMAVLIATDATVYAVLALVAFELAVGGLDNLLSHHQQAASAARWSWRTLGASALLAAALILARATSIDPAIIDALVWAAVVTSALGVAGEFWRGRATYLDEVSPAAKPNPASAARKP
jgi:CDP-diacylglycerol--glycerol-3-phosphate 3-phosphatidyltransferase